MNFKLNIQLFGNAVIPYNEGRNGKRSIDGLWEQEFNVAKALTAAIGCEFGSVLNIQDAGQKEQGKVYLDKNNGKLYKCLNTTTSVSNTTENFALFNVQQNSDRLDNLSGNVQSLSNYAYPNTINYDRYRDRWYWYNETQARTFLVNGSLLQDDLPNSAHILFVLVSVDIIVLLLYGWSHNYLYKASITSNNTFYGFSPII